MEVKKGTFYLDEMYGCNPHFNTRNGGYTEYTDTNFNNFKISNKLIVTLYNCLKWEIEGKGLDFQEWYEKISSGKCDEMIDIKEY
jgi:hypothetical protein